MMRRPVVLLVVWVPVNSKGLEVGCSVSATVLVNCLVGGRLEGKDTVERHCEKEFSGYIQLLRVFCITDDHWEELQLPSFVCATMRKLILRETGK